MAVIIAGNVAYDLSKAFKIAVSGDLIISYPFYSGVGECWVERLPLNKDTDGEALFAYLVQAKESDVILIWEDLLKNFRKKPERREEVQLREEVERLRSEVKRLRNECSLLMSDFDALKRRFEESEEDEEYEEDDELIPVAEPGT